MPHAHPPGAGKSSYDLIDGPLFWSALSLEPGMTVLDLGCGAGLYTKEIADRIQAGTRHAPLKRTSPMREANCPWPTRTWTYA